jgi:hypothetical protein
MQEALRCRLAARADQQVEAARTHREVRVRAISGRADAVELSAPRGASVRAVTSTEPVDDNV